MSTRLKQDKSCTSEKAKTWMKAHYSTIHSTMHQDNYFSFFNKRVYIKAIILFGQQLSYLNEGNCNNNDYCLQENRSGWDKSIPNDRGSKQSYLVLLSHSCYYILTRWFGNKVIFSCSKSLGISRVCHKSNAIIYLHLLQWCPRMQ